MIYAELMQSYKLWPLFKEESDNIREYINNLDPFKQKKGLY